MNIDLETFKLITKSGVIMGQNNPNIDPDLLVDAIVCEMGKQALYGYCEEGDE